MALRGESILKGTGISKAYGPALVLDDVDFDVRGGEVHALVGENGAGKSTLLGILSGTIKPSAGTITLDDRSFDQLSPALAAGLGIALVPQHLELAEDMSVADNLFMARWPTFLGLLRHDRINQESRRLLARVGLTIDPELIVRDLSYVDRQLVELARVYERGSRFVILDEPTAALSVHEVRILFDMILELREAGLGIVYVSHYLSEVSQIADRLTVLRDGRVVATGDAASFTLDSIVRMMVGDAVSLYAARARQYGRVLFELENVSAGRIEKVNLQVRKGEIVGIVAPKGEGVSPFLRSVCGVAGKAAKGRLLLEGRAIRIRNPAQALRLGIAYLGEDRFAWGLLQGRSVCENILISSYRKIGSHLGLIGRREEAESVNSAIERLHVRPADPQAEAQSLSGGNQQKMLMARLVKAEPKIFILDDPTFGVDVASKAEIHRLLGAVVESGGSILMHTTDLDELMRMADRILVVIGGHVAHEYLPAELTVEELVGVLEKAVA